MKSFRKLKADEIECRVGSVSKDGKGFSLLLYKDARVDMKILDETVGPLNWQKEYSRDNANCTVGIWDEDKKQWIRKEDTGTESNTEAEKGLASDSFKRACFAWGIGRELYTAPFIWITGYDKYDKFTVTSIGYDEDGNIQQLTIIENKSKAVVYGNKASNKPQEAPKAAEGKSHGETISPAQKAQILKEMNRLQMTDEAKVAGVVGCKKLDEIPARLFEKLYKSMLTWT